MIVRNHGRVLWSGIPDMGMMVEGNYLPEESETQRPGVSHHRALYGGKVMQEVSLSLKDALRRDRGKQSFPRRTWTHQKYAVGEWRVQGEG